MGNPLQPGGPSTEGLADSSINANDSRSFLGIRHPRVVGCRGGGQYVEGLRVSWLLVFQVVGFLGSRLLNLLVSWFLGFSVSGVWLSVCSFLVSCFLGFVASCVSVSWFLGFVVSWLLGFKNKSFNVFSKILVPYHPISISCVCCQISLTSKISKVCLDGSL